jgi:hypothetical protein
MSESEVSNSKLFQTLIVLIKKLDVVRDDVRDLRAQLTDVDQLEDLALAIADAGIVDFTAVSLLEAANYDKALRLAVEAACGEGPSTRRLARFLAAAVGVDVCGRRLRIARRDSAGRRYVFVSV